MRGDDVVKVQRRAGHKLIATTMRYIVEAENRGDSHRGRLIARDRGDSKGFELPLPSRWDGK